MRWSTLFLCLFLLASCSENGGRRQSQTSVNLDTNDEDANSPTTPSLGSTNFLQNGSQTSTTSFTIAADTQDVVYLRGDEVQAFIENNVGQDLCLAVPFSINNSAYNLVLLLVQDDFLNLSTNEREFFFKVQANNPALNSTGCPASTFASTLGSSTIRYDLDNVCPSCTSPFSSSSLKLYDQSGNLFFHGFINFDMQS